MDAQDKAKASCGCHTDEGPSKARRIGRGAAAAIGGATLSLPVAASAMAMPACACGGAHAPPPKPPADPPQSRSQSAAPAKTHSSPPPSHPASPPPRPADHPAAPAPAPQRHFLSPDAADANRAAEQKRKSSPPAPKPAAKADPPRRPRADIVGPPAPAKVSAPKPAVTPSPDAVDRNREAREQSKPVYGPPTPPPKPVYGPPTPQPQVTPSPDAMDANREARAKQQPAPEPKFSPTPDSVDRNREARERNKPVYGPPTPPPKVSPSPNSVDRNREARAKQPQHQQVPSVVEKKPVYGPPLPPFHNALSMLDPLAALRGQPTPPRHDAYPTTGPALADAPADEIGLPFPGSVATDFGCGYGTKGSSCSHIPTPDPKKTPGLDASIELTRTEVKKRGEEDLGEDGRKVSLEVSGDWAVNEKLSLETKKQIELELQHSVSRGVSYEATLDPARAEAISNDEEAPPNPIDPASLKKGDGLVFAHEHTDGDSQAVGYKLVKAGASHETGTRESTGVTRVDDKTVRVYVGNEELVRNAVSFGVGIDELGATIGNSSEFDRGKVRQVEIDTSTKAGQDAYRRFIGSGSLPDAKTRGVEDSAIADTARWSSKSELSVHIGPLKVGTSAEGGKGVVTEVKHADGRIERTFTTDHGDVGAISKRTDQKSQPTQAGFTLLLQDVHHDYVDGYRQLHGIDEEVDGNKDLRVDFTEQDLNEMRDQAVEQLVDYTEQMRQPLTPTEVREKLRDHEPVMAMGVQTEMIAGAKSPDEVLDAVDRIARSNSTAAVEFLEKFTTSTWRARRQRSDALGKLTIVNPRP